MKLFKQKYRIESARLKDYDYAQAGAYFITICTHHHENLFGEVREDIVELNSVGEIVQKYWEEIPAHFPFVELWQRHPFGRRVYCHARSCSWYHYYK